MMGGVLYEGEIFTLQTEYRNDKAHLSGFGLAPLQAFALEDSPGHPPRWALCVLAREARAVVRLLGGGERPSAGINLIVAGKPIKSRLSTTEEMSGGEGMIRFIAGTSRSGPVKKPVEFPDKVVRLLDGGARWAKMDRGIRLARNPQREKPLL